MQRFAVTMPLVLAVALVAPAAWSDVAPGDVITPENKERVEGLIPEPFYPFVIDRNNELRMEIVEQRDYLPHEKYREATVKYACQAELDEHGNITNYTAGQPFPYSEWAKEATNHACDLTPSDPQFALKLAWNVNYRWQGGSGFNLPHLGFSYERNRGNDTWRLWQGEYRRTYFSHRADLLPETHELRKGTELEWAEFFDVRDPFDLRGTMFLLYRYLDSPNREDDTWAYVPALRRIRRIATTQKSDSLLGMEFTLEDFYLFAGYVWDHRWEYQGEATRLVAFDYRTCFPNMISEEEAKRVTGMTRLGKRDEWEQCEFSPYGALPFTDTQWEKRAVLQLDDVPTQEGHPYSRKKIWYDKQTMMPLYAVVYDRSGEPYRILAAAYRWTERTGHPANEGKHALVLVNMAIANLQNDNSNSGQFYSANYAEFGIEESQDYFDINRLKERGR